MNKNVAGWESGGFFYSCIPFDPGIKIDIDSNAYRCYIYYDRHTTIDVVTTDVVIGRAVTGRRLQNGRDKQ